MATEGLVSVMLRQHPADPREGTAHVTVQVFIGRNINARGHAGDIVVRKDEWDELASGRLRSRLLEIA